MKILGDHLGQFLELWARRALEVSRRKIRANSAAFITENETG